MAPGAVRASWSAVGESPVPVLYYVVEYKSASDSMWLSSDPVLSNGTELVLTLPIAASDQIQKYYFRVRAYGLLAYSDHTEAKIILLPGM